MASRRPGSGGPDEGTPEYRWLYGDDPTEKPRGDQRAPRPEETRLIRTPSQGSGDKPPPYPPPDTAGRPPRSPRSGRRRYLRIAGLFLALWLVFLIAVPIFAWNKVSQVDVFSGDRPAEQPGTTYLLVGSDSREGLTKAERKELGTGGAAGRRTDTIMLLHTGSGPNVLMSIPRDSIVPIPGKGTSKINAAYAWGGAPLLTQTIEQNTGIRVDHYVEIGFGGFVDVVDAVGGIEICPKKAMKDKDANLDIAAGCQEADGKTALGYARSRKTYTALGDVDRAKAQREVVSAVGAAALSPWTFINPKRYYDLAMATAGSFTVSEGTSLFNMARFGWGMTRLDSKAGMSCGVPIRDLAVNWDDERSERFFEHLRADTTDEIGKGLCTPSGLPK